MTDPTPPDLPANAKFINPPTMHQPTGYSHVVEMTEGRPVYIAGQIALDPTGALVGPDDIRAQTRQVFQNLQAALQAVGVGFEHVVKLNYYLVDATQTAGGSRGPRRVPQHPPAARQHGRRGPPPRP